MNRGILACLEDINNLVTADEEVIMQELQAAGNKDELRVYLQAVYWKFPTT